MAAALPHRYDAREKNSPTYLGADERTHEMCNQYASRSWLIYDLGEVGLLTAGTLPVGT
jgi:hypothetical protein